VAIGCGGSGGSRSFPVSMYRSSWWSVGGGMSNGFSLGSSSI
jgi:hypothetical protein